MTKPPRYRLKAWPRVVAHAFVAEVTVVFGVSGLGVAVGLAAIIPILAWMGRTLVATPDRPAPLLALPLPEEPPGPLRRPELPPDTVREPWLSSHAGAAAVLALVTCAAAVIVLHDDLLFRRFLDRYLHLADDFDMGLYYYYIKRHRINFSVGRILLAGVLPCAAAACFEATLAVLTAVWSRIPGQEPQNP